MIFEDCLELITEIIVFGIDVNKCAFAETLMTCIFVVFNDLDFLLLSI